MSGQIDDSVEVKLRQERSGRPLCAKKRALLAGSANG
jgi:hypothetical protein